MKITVERDPGSAHTETLAGPAGPPEEAETRARLQQLIADIAELPPRQRGALVMREMNDLSYKQIGEALETSAAVARQTIYEARLSLRQEFAALAPLPLAASAGILQGLLGGGAAGKREEGEVPPERRYY